MTIGIIIIMTLDPYLVLTAPIRGCENHAQVVGCLVVRVILKNLSFRGIRTGGINGHSIGGCHVQLHRKHRNASGFTGRTTDRTDGEPGRVIIDVCSEHIRRVECLIHRV